MLADPQHSESISHRHGKVKTSQVSHRITHSSQLVVLMPAWGDGGVKEQKEKNTQKKTENEIHFPLSLERINRPPVRFSA